MNRSYRLAAGLIANLCLCMLFNCKSFGGSKKIVPGRIVVEFSAGTVVSPREFSTGPIGTLELPLPIVEACSALNVTRIEKMFPSSIPNESKAYSPIHDEMVPMIDLSQHFILTFPESVDVKKAMSLMNSMPTVKRAWPDTYANFDEWTLPHC